MTVASELTQRFPGQVNFQVIGRIPEPLKRANLSKLSLLSATPGTERISREEFVSRIKSLHFVCLFFNKYYEFAASGVLMDSIAWGKPIIATQLPIVDTLQQSFGDIGYLSAENELCETISSIIQTGDRDRYQHQVLNMSRVKDSRTPETLALKYLGLVNGLQNR